MKKILFVEDEYHFQRKWNEVLGGKALILHATSISKAEELFESNPDVAAIVMDGCVDGGVIDTIPLVKKIRETFSGPIVAASSSTTYTNMLVEAGCDYRAPFGDKKAVPRMLVEMFNL